MKVLVTGGAGYIGATICSALIDAGHTPVILDSFVNGRREYADGRISYEGDIADAALLDRIFSGHADIACAIHCAALITVPESVSDPYRYYRENVGKSTELFHQLVEHGVKRVIFSSSGAIYDDVPDFEVTEDAPLNPRSPYARTKFMMEQVLRDYTAAYDLKAIALRYFNPIGADPKLRTGLQQKLPTHVLGKLISVAAGREPEFTLTGVDWPTRDGTAIKDYIHVWDLARAHVVAAERFDDAFEPKSEKFSVINLGTGTGVTVREIVTAFEKVLGREIPKREAPPRDGDVPGAYANAEKAARLLGWRTERSIEDGIADALRWDEVRDTILK
ncbi:MAG: UDP-glucose 4-epimerase GalE [Oscillospiraceae bacterium]|jgi:UDP-glucose 4-epimerase|nr:UDP-glucose 4-epimerase GalE [Oscillospiraceae bacterium]